MEATCLAVFERYEKKYLLTAEQYMRLRESLSARMEEDSHGLHTIRSIYYDTPSFSLIRASLEKPVYKEKLRLRAYGRPGQDSTVFMELKKKFNGVVYKRRVPLKLWQLNQYLEEGRKPEESGQIFQEIDWFLKRREPEAKVFLAYDRLALSALDESDLRITFDFRVRCRQDRLFLDADDCGDEILKQGQCLMEIKLLGAIPLWLCRAFSHLHIKPTTFSKYGTYYQQNICALGEKENV